MRTVKLTSKTEGMIPRDIRSALGIKIGDKIVYRIKNKAVVIQKAEDAEDGYLRALDMTLSEWNSASDDSAFEDL